MKALAKHLGFDALALLLGALAFFMVVGPRVLDPQNIAWLASGDPATHYLGWEFFRQGPWTFPLGLNPGYGLELSSSIIFSDSNPLLAFVFKPFASLLPATFQYFGLWLLLCFALQAWFAFKLLGHVTASPVLRLLGAGLFVLSPPLMLRIGGHLSLVGHFLILAGLYLAFHPALRRRRLAWGALLVVTALVHSYLLAMVAALWVADLLGKVVQKQLPRTQAWRELALMFACVALACWQAGYFSVGNGTVSGGFGLYRLNLLSIVDSSGWSYVLKDLPEGAGDYEGFNYLGLGAIFLVLCALVPMLQGKARLRELFHGRLMLGLMLLALTLFAISHQIGLGPWALRLPIPGFVENLANVFRASGRMFWPVFYVMIFAAVFLVVRGCSRRVATVLLALALVMQVLDTRAGWTGLRQTLMAAPASQWPSPLIDPFWEQAGAHYKKVRWVQPQNTPPAWSVLASYAAAHRMGTDAVYLGRMSKTALKQMKQKTATAIASGQYEADSLYVLDEPSVRQVASSLNRSTDLLARIDGYTVLAPGWKHCATCLAVPAELDPHALMPTQEAASDILGFAQGNPGTAYLLSGWSGPEAWGTWSDGDSAQLLFKPAGPVRALRLETRALVIPSHPHQDVQFSVNDVPVRTVRLIKFDGNQIDLDLPAAAQQAIAREGVVRLAMTFLNAVSPQELGLGADDRRLVLGIKTLAVQ